MLRALSTLAVLGLPFAPAGAQAVGQAPPLTDGVRGAGAVELELEPAWIPLGPFGGDVSDVAVKPGEENVVLAGIAPSVGYGEGVFRSTNAGVSWFKVDGVAGLSVNDLEFAADGTAWMGTGDGLWKSITGGASWTDVPLGLGQNNQVLEVTLDPLLPGRLWIGLYDALDQTHVVLRSDNGGASWRNVSPPLETPPLVSPQSCKGIAVDPADSNRVFACFAGIAGGGEIWRSLNGGRSWTNVSAGLPASPLNDVSIDGSRVLVCGGQLLAGQGVGLYESLADGVGWTPLHDATWPLLVINDIEVDPADASKLYLASAGAGVFRSVDGGKHWEFRYGGTGGLSVNAVCVAPSGAAPVYSGSASAAVWKSPSGGAFAPSSAGIGSLDAVSIAANPLSPEELALAFSDPIEGASGVYTSLNGGLTWTPEPLPIVPITKVSFAPNGTLYAAAAGVYRRDPERWVYLGPGEGPLYALAFSPTDPDLIFAAGDVAGTGGATATIWRTPDAGLHWAKVYEGTEQDEVVWDVALLPTGDGMNLVAAFQNGIALTGGALISTDAGHSWWISSDGLPAFAQGMSIAVDTLDPWTVYLAEDQFAAGVYRSIDGGVSWSPYGGARRPYRLATDPLRPERFFVAQRYDSPLALVSNDGGLSYLSSTSGLDLVEKVNDLALAPGPCERLLLATDAGAFGRVASCPFEGLGTAVSVAAGGAQQLALAQGPAAAGSQYWILGSASGTSPGTSAFGLTLPLNPDFYLSYTLNHASDGLVTGGAGVLDFGGEAHAFFSLPAGLLDPALVGTTVHHAFASASPGPQSVFGVSNAVAVLLAP